MNDLMVIAYSGDRPTVLGRDLHAALDVDSNYSTWMNRMIEYGFCSGLDFIPFSEESTGGRPSVNHQLSLSMAKELCMIQRTAKGKQVRQYFIDLESKWNSPELVMARALQISDRKVRELETGLLELRPKAEYFDALISRDHMTNFRDTAKMLGVGERELIGLLLDNGYLYRDRSGKLVPYADKNRGYFALKEFVDTRTGHAGVQTLVTVLGREHLLNLAHKTA